MAKILVVFLCIMTCVEAKRVLFVAGLHQGKEEIFHQKRESQQTTLQPYFEAWWQVIQELRRKDIQVDFSTHEFVSDKLSRFPKAYDLYIFQNYKCYIAPEIQKRAFLILFEPAAVLPLQYNQSLLQSYAKVFSWHDALVKEEKAIKFCYPVWKPFEGGKPFSERKNSCMISSHKSSSYPHELYGEREKIIRHYEGSSLFDLYGRKWEKEYLSVYRGMSQNKIDDLKNYRFVYCLENSCQDNPGYITEKIFDAFAAGTIPIYWGAPNVDQYIPKGCYIDYTLFSSLDELDQFLINFTEERYLEYLANIQDFLSSSAASPFRNEAFSQLMLSEILHYFEEN